MRAGEAGEAPSGGHQRIGRSTHEETTLSETRRYRKFTAKQKLGLVLASLRGERSVAERCREQALEAASERFADGEQRSQAAEQRRRIAELERALGRKTYEAEILGNG